MKQILTFILQLLALVALITLGGPIIIKSIGDKENPYFWMWLLFFWLIFLYKIITGK